MQSILIITIFLFLGSRRSRSRVGNKVCWFSSMNLSMPVKTAGCREGFATHWTHIRRFSCVSFYMSPQVSSYGKSLFTLRAVVGLLPCVYSTVCVQASGLGEGLVTEGAGERLVSCVCPLVTLQGTRLRESLVTLGAGIRLFSGVNSHVSPQMF